MLWLGHLCKVAAQSICLCHCPVKSIRVRICQRFFLHRLCCGKNGVPPSKIRSLHNRQLLTRVYSSTRVCSVCNELLCRAGGLRRQPFYHGYEREVTLGRYRCAAAV